MANPSSRVLYTGMTGNLQARVFTHKERGQPGFTAKYNVTSLVYIEECDGPNSAIMREKQIKGWLRQRKIELIESINPTWKDLSDGWFGEMSPKNV